MALIAVVLRPGPRGLHYRGNGDILQNAAPDGIILTRRGLPHKPALHGGPLDRQQVSAILPAIGPKAGRSYPPEKLQDVYRKEKKDGSGDVIIARRAWRDSDGDRHCEELGFLRVRNPREVEQMLNKLAQTAPVK